MPIVILKGKNITKKCPLFLIFIVLPMVLGINTTLWAESEDNSENLLDTLVVTASRFEEKLREVSSNTTVITAEKIQLSTATNLRELMSQNGFFTQDQGSVSFLSIRGMSQGFSNDGEVSNPVLILINGRRTGLDNVKNVGLDNIEQIEVIRGPSAVQYGPSAMGGVVNIITKKGSPGTSLKVEAGLGSNSLRRESLSISGAENEFDFSAGFTEMGHSDYHISNGDRYFGTGIKSSFTGNAGIGYTISDRHRLGLDFNYFRTNRFSGSGYSHMSSTAPCSEYVLSNNSLALTYDGKNQDETFSWGGSYGFSTNTNDIKDLPNGPSLTETDVKTATAYLGYDRGMIATLLGFDYVDYDIDQTKNSWAPSARYKNMAGYFSGKLRLFDESIILSAGARYDHFSVSAGENNTLFGNTAAIPEISDNNFASSLGAAYIPTDWLKLRVNYAEGFKMASPAELGGGNGSLGNYLPNSGLKPEKSKTFEAGFDVSYDFVDASLTYFHTDYKNKISAISLGNSSYQYQNIRAAVFEGLELATSADIGQALDQNFELRPFINLTYMTSLKNKDQSQILAYNSNKMPLTPELTVNYGLLFNYPDWTFSSNLNATYFSGVYSTDYRAILGNSWGTQEYIKGPSSTVFNLSLDKGLADFGSRGRLSFRGEINNILNDNNETYLDYPGSGRTFYTGLRYDF